MSCEQNDKLRALIRANDNLKKELNQARREQQDNYRVKLIKQLRVKLRDQEALTAAFKEQAALSDDDIIAVYDQVLNTALRPRQPLPEELNKKIAVLTRQNAKLVRKIAAINKQRGGGGTSSSSTRSSITQVGAAGQAALLSEADAALRSTTLDKPARAAIAQYKQLAKDAEMRARELRQYKGKWERACSREREKEAAIASLRQELIEAATDKESLLLMQKQQSGRSVPSSPNNGNRSKKSSGSKRGPSDENRGSTAKERALMKEVEKLRLQIDAAREAIREHKEQLTEEIDADTEVISLRAQLEVAQEELVQLRVSAGGSRMKQKERGDLFVSEEADAPVQAVGAGTAVAAGGKPSLSAGGGADDEVAAAEHKAMVAEAALASYKRKSQDLNSLSAEQQRRIKELEQQLATATAVNDRLKERCATLSEQCERQQLASSDTRDGDDVIKALQEEVRTVRSDNEAVAEEALHNASLVRSIRDYSLALLNHVDVLEKAMKGVVPPLPVPSRPEPPYSVTDAS